MRIRWLNEDWCSAQIRNDTSTAATVAICSHESTKHQHYKYSLQTTNLRERSFGIQCSTFRCTIVNKYSVNQWITNSSTCSIRHSMHSDTQFNFTKLMKIAKLTEQKTHNSVTDKHIQRCQATVRTIDHNQRLTELPVRQVQVSQVSGKLSSLEPQTPHTDLPLCAVSPVVWHSSAGSTFHENGLRRAWFPSLALCRLKLFTSLHSRITRDFFYGKF